MSKITTHILDLAQGRPAAGVPVTLEFQTNLSLWEPIAAAQTDNDGRIRNWLASEYSLKAGTYRIRFDTGAYFAARNQNFFFPEVMVVFAVQDTTQHYHVPLLLSPFGYSTYRGS
jgi:5-hydroxyisourate hydrolase